MVEEAAKIIQTKIDNGTLKMAPGVTYKFAGNYEQQIRATKRLGNCYPDQLNTDLAFIVFPIPDNNCIIYSLFRCIRSFCRWFYYALVIWSGLVYEFFCCRYQPS